MLAALNVEHGAAGEGLTEGEKKASLEVGAFFPFFSGNCQQLGGESIFSPIFLWKLSKRSSPLRQYQGKARGGSTIRSL